MTFRPLLLLLLLLPLLTACHRNPAEAYVVFCSEAAEKVLHMTSAEQIRKFTQRIEVEKREYVEAWQSYESQATDNERQLVQSAQSALDIAITMRSAKLEQATDSVPK